MILWFTPHIRICTVLFSFSFPHSFSSLSLRPIPRCFRGPRVSLHRCRQRRRRCLRRHRELSLSQPFCLVSLSLCLFVRSSLFSLFTFFLVWVTSHTVPSRRHASTVQEGHNCVLLARPWRACPGPNARLYRWYPYLRRNAILGHKHSNNAAKIG